MLRPALRRAVVMSSLLATCVVSSVLPATFAGASGSAPVANWDVVGYSTVPAHPFGSMVSDGTNVWAPEGTLTQDSYLAEVTPGAGGTGPFAAEIPLTDGTGSIVTSGMVAYGGGSIWTSGWYRSGSHSGTGALLRVNPVTATITGVWPCASLGGPATYAMSRAVTIGNALWVTDEQWHLWKLTDLSAATPQFTAIGGLDPSTQQVSNLAADGNSLWLGFSTPNGHLPRYDVTDSTTTLGAPSLNASYSGAQPYAMTASFGAVWVSENSSGNVRLSEINATTGAELHTGLVAGNFPGSLAYDGVWIWAADLQSGGTGTIVGLLASDPSVSNTISLQAPPPTGFGATSGVLFTGGNLWAAEQTDGTIERLALYPSAPAITALTPRNDCTADVSFGAPTFAGNTPVVDYAVKVSPSEGIEASQILNNQLTLSHLSPNTTYSVQVVASNSTYSTASRTKDFTTSSCGTTPTTAAGGLASTGSTTAGGVVAGSSLVLLGLGLVAWRSRRPRRLA